MAFRGAFFLNNLWGLVREINPSDISRDSERSFSILIAGWPDAGKTTLRGAINGSRWPTDQTLPYVRIVEGESEESYGASICLYVVDASRGLFRDVLAEASFIKSRGVPVIFVFNKMDLVARTANKTQKLELKEEKAIRREYEESARLMAAEYDAPAVFIEATDAQSVRDILAPAVIAALPDLTLALGRRLPTFREAAALSIIQKTSWANAEFALISSLPANIPIVNIGVIGADLAVLTKNQAMMLLKLASIYGRSLESKAQIIAELAPVVGAAFLWRTVARAAIGLLPGIISAAPRALIGFIGTFVVGQAAFHYYRLGKRPSREALDRYSKDAIDLARRLVPGQGARKIDPSALPALDAASQRPLTSSPHIPAPLALPPGADAKTGDGLLDKLKRRLGWRRS